MSATKDGDTLLEIRHEYKAKKKQLEKYDTFIDRHQGLVVFVPLLLVLIGMIAIAALTKGATVEQAGNDIAVKIVGVLSLALLIVAIVMAFITGSRKSAKNKIAEQLEALIEEAAVFQKHARDHENISRDELNLWRDIERGTGGGHSNKGGWVMIIVVIVIVAVASSISQANQRSQEAAERARQTQIIEQQRARQEQDAIEQRKLDQQDEANRLQQQQNAIDLYNSTKSNSNDYRSSTNCSTSYYGGYTAYTTCD